MRRQKFDCHWGEPGVLLLPMLQCTSQPNPPPPRIDRHGSKHQIVTSIHRAVRGLIRLFSYQPMIVLPHHRFFWGFFPGFSLDSDVCVYILSSRSHYSVDISLNNIHFPHYYNALIHFTFIFRYMHYSQTWWCLPIAQHQGGRHERIAASFRPSKSAKTNTKKQNKKPKQTQNQINSMNHK